MGNMPKISYLKIYENNPTVFSAELQARWRDVAGQHSESGYLSTIISEAASPFTEGCGESWWKDKKIDELFYAFL